MLKVLAGLLNPNKLQLFEHLFLPVVLRARDKLVRNVDPAVYGLLTSTAHAGWERYLLHRLVTAGAQAVDWQFQVFKTVQGAFSDQTRGIYRDPDALWHGFIGGRPEDRLQRLFQEFPALEELSATLVRNWLTTVTEFLDRLHRDRGSSADFFEGEQFICLVSGIQAGLSDPHHGGRCVVRLLFTSGARLIYKPRSIATETVFADLIDALNASSVPHSLRAARCWDRAGYGWMEDMQQHDCSDLDEVHAFYWRAGALLGLVYMACGVDFHRENLIAHGAFPVLIDLETLWHPQELRGSAHDVAATSVLRTGFLPQRNPKIGKVYEYSALSRSAGSVPLASGRTGIHQDDIDAKAGSQTPGNYGHLPTMNGVPSPAAVFVGDIQAGFQWIGDRLTQDDIVCSEFERWLRAVKACSRRRIHRSTVDYHTTLKRITLPQFLRQKWPSATVLAELVQRGSLELDSEMQAVEQLDIPYFTQDDRASDFDACLPSKGKLLAQLSVIDESLTGTGLM